MKFETKKVTLKNGVEAIFRHANPSDALELINHVKLVAGQTHFIMRYPEEMTITEEMEIKFINSRLESPYALMMVCEIAGHITGTCEINFNNRIKTKHRAAIGIGIQEAYWNLGIGTAMFKEMIEVAKNIDGVMQLELEFIEGNERGLRLYEKMGFEMTGFKPNAIRLKDGTLLKIFEMVKVL